MAPRCTQPEGSACQSETYQLIAPLLSLPVKVSGRSSHVVAGWSSEIASGTAAACLGGDTGVSTGGFTVAGGGGVVGSVLKSSAIAAVSPLHPPARRWRSGPPGYGARPLYRRS